MLGTYTLLRDSLNYKKRAVFTYCFDWDLSLCAEFQSVYLCLVDLVRDKGNNTYVFHFSGAYVQASIQNFSLTKKTLFEIFKLYSKVHRISVASIHFKLQIKMESWDETQRFRL